MFEPINYKEEKRKKEFIWLERFSSLLDNKFNIGGFRFGLDPLLNLIPYGGQAVSFGASLLLVIIILRNGAGSKVVVKMLLNIIYDAVLGTIPFFGQVFDFFNKANTKNIKLLREHYFENKHQGSAKGLLITMVVILFVLCAALFYLLWIFGKWVWSLI